MLLKYRGNGSRIHRDSIIISILARIRVQKQQENAREICGGRID